MDLHLYSAFPVQWTLKVLYVLATVTHSHTHSYTDGGGCHARCQLCIRSNLGFSILLKDASTCSSTHPGGDGIWTSNLPWLYTVWLGTSAQLGFISPLQHCYLLQGVPFTKEHVSQSCLVCSKVMLFLFCFLFYFGVSLSSRFRSLPALVCFPSVLIVPPFLMCFTCISLSSPPLSVRCLSFLPVHLHLL